MDTFIRDRTTWKVSFIVLCNVNIKWLIMLILGKESYPRLGLLNSELRRVVGDLQGTATITLRGRER